MLTLDTETTPKMAPLQLNSSPLIFRLVYLSAYKIHRIPSLPVSLYLSFSHPRCPRFDATLTLSYPTIQIYYPSLYI